MSAELKKRCFMLFGNLKFKKDINQGGIGLGLTASSQICKALSGELNLIRSELGEGAKFQFTMEVQSGERINESSSEKERRREGYRQMLVEGAERQEESNSEEDQSEEHNQTPSSDEMSSHSISSEEGEDEVEEMKQATISKHHQLEFDLMNSKTESKMSIMSPQPTPSLKNLTKIDGSNFWLKKSARVVTLQQIPSNDKIGSMKFSSIKAGIKQFSRQSIVDKEDFSYCSKDGSYPADIKSLQKLKKRSSKSMIGFLGSSSKLEIPNNPSFDRDAGESDSISGYNQSDDYESEEEKSGANFDSQDSSHNKDSLQIPEE